MGAAALAACGASVPSPSVARPIRWVRVSTAGLTTGQPRWVEIARSAAAGPSGSATQAVTAGSAPPSPAADRSGAWLVRGGDDSLTAFDGHCTHESCLYDWEAADWRFACRCHKGFFRLDGSVISGPPPRALDRFETRPAGASAVEIAFVDRGPLGD